MARKTITLDEEIIENLNRKRLGGETWNEFFHRILDHIPERTEWEKGVKDDR